MSSKKERDNLFLGRLFSVARDLQRLKRSQQCAADFDSDVCNKFQKITEKFEDESISQLTMEAKEDSDYDIDEIRFWNFISKNKGVKPNIIRTVVYKIPESTYVSRKCHTFINEKSPKKEYDNQAFTSLIKTSKCDILLEKETQTILSDIISIITQNDHSKNKYSIHQDKRTSLENYNIEDLILIDDEAIDKISAEDKQECKKIINRSNGKIFKALSRNKPKVIVEKVKEPISIIKVESDLSSLPRQNTLSSSEENENDSIKKYFYSTSSSSSSSSISTNINIIQENNNNKLSRLTRSKAKLTNN
jgi:hypothetical protein